MAGIMKDNPLFVNNKLSDTRILFLGKNENTKKVALYALAVVTSTDLNGINRRYLSVTTENNYIYSNSGSIVADMPSQQTQPEGTFELEVSLDYNTQNVKAKAGMTTNLLESVLLASGFYHGNDWISIIGTNGTLKRTGIKATKCEINRPAGASFFAYEINNLATSAIGADGRPVFTTNSFLKSKLETGSWALETYELLDSGNSSSSLLPLCYLGNTSFAQADDTAKMSGTIMRPTDCWDSTESLLTGQREYNVITDLDKVYFEVDAIIQNAGGVAPSDFVLGANTTPTIALIDSATGAFTIQTSNGVDTWTPSAVGGMVGYCKISANVSGASTLALATPQRVFAVVTSVGATNNAGFLVNTYDEGSSKDYVYSTFTLNRKTQEWEAYAIEATC